ncbi:hypothetical protein [Salmonella phage SD-1_S14]|nr:hypothetical protein [Salmonella phage SD-1_S14]
MLKKKLSNSSLLVTVIHQRMRYQRTSILLNWK